MDEIVIVGKNGIIMTLPSNDFSNACYFCGSKVNYPFYIYRRNELDIESDDMIAVCSNHLHRPFIIKLGDEHGNYIDYKLSQKTDWIGPEGDPRFSYGEKTGRIHMTNIGSDS